MARTRHCTVREGERQPAQETPLLPGSEDSTLKAGEVAGRYFVVTHPASIQRAPALLQSKSSITVLGFFYESDGPLVTIVLKIFFRWALSSMHYPRQL